MAEENTIKKPTTSHNFTHKYGDPWIWGIFIALMIISVIENYSASSVLVSSKGIFTPIIKHTAFLLVGVGITTFVARRDYYKPGFILLSVPVLSAFTVLTLVYVRFFGAIVNGARRAINIAGVSFQPAELAKVSIVTVLAYVLARNQEKNGLSNKGLLIAIVIVALYAAPMIQSGLTNCLLLGAICLTMILIGGSSLKKLAIVGLAVGFIMGMGWLVKSCGDDNDETLRNAEAAKTEQVDVASKEPVSEMEEVFGNNEKKANDGDVNRWAMRMDRVIKWWYNDSLVYWPIDDKNSQEMFSRMAQAHGGVVGVGVGGNREGARLPLAFSDYIYSIIIEETGLVGGIIVLVLYLSLLGRATIIVRKCKRAWPSLIIIGIASAITFQALFHMAINTGVFPVSGQPLPLISAGGTSVLVMSLAFGIMLSVSRTISIVNKSNKNKEEEPEIELPEGLDAENLTQITPKNVWK
ncbi:FtsW/RodA/SpoVE family cell cycle protein [Sodaliphilus sp.]|uniref:FtsW/RodA/SpoVE family cell cycle protein n=1 Tax=Sodaliphilus sp. TaxID=2815818 RepID=UPI00388FC441